MKNIYLAGPFFSTKQMLKVEKLREVLNCNISVGNVFVPMEHQTIEGCEQFSVEWGKGIYKSDMKNLTEADVIVAIIDFDGEDCDSGTAFELGVAKAMNKHIVIIQEDKIETNLMLSGSADYSVDRIQDLQNYDFDKLEKNEFKGKVF